MLCGDLNGKEIQKGGDICIGIAHQLYWTVETNTTQKLLLLLFLLLFPKNLLLFQINFFKKIP